MQYVIKQVRADGSFYWTGSCWTEDRDEAYHYNHRDDADQELADMDKPDRHNALVIAVDPE